MNIQTVNAAYDKATFDTESFADFESATFCAQAHALATQVANMNDVSALAYLSHLRRFKSRRFMNDVYDALDLM